MSNISFKIPLKHIHLLDELVNEGKFNTRGEAIREGIISMLNEILLEPED
jgi:Arc/MetJ-type ribon-helix-helix transcriptional regulator